MHCIALFLVAHLVLLLRNRDRCRTLPQTHKLMPCHLMIIAIHDTAIGHRRVRPGIGHALQGIRGKGRTDQGHRASRRRGLYPYWWAAQPAAIEATHRLQHGMLWRGGERPVKAWGAMVCLFAASKQGHQTRWRLTVGAGWCHSSQAATCDDALQVWQGPTLQEISHEGMGCAVPNEP